MALKGEAVVAPEEGFHIERSLAHGHVEAVLGTIRRIGLDAVIASKRSRERDLIVAMIAERLLHPSSKLPTARLMSTTTLAEELSLTNADEDDLYQAMDWLLSRQETIESKLAAKHGSSPASPARRHGEPARRSTRQRSGKKWGAYSSSSRWASTTAS
jgi:hypothetical protein